MAARRRRVGTARPGSTVTRRVTSGRRKGDTVTFVANSSSARQPGKLKPRRVVTDRGKKQGQLSGVKGGVGRKRKARRRKK